MNYSDEHDTRLRLILKAVVKRINDRVDSIDPVFQFKTGIEGWFKVELVYALKALGEKVIALKNKGPDIILTEGLQIELKAATDFNPSYLRDGALKDKVPCIFLGSGERNSNIERLKSMSQIQVIDIIVFRGIHKWAVGCIIPKVFMHKIKGTGNEGPANPEIHKQSSINDLNNDMLPRRTQKEPLISKRLRLLNPSSDKMTDREDDILSVGGTWEELIAKVRIEAKKMNNKIHYTKGVILQHIKYRREKQKNTEYLRNMIINDEGIFPRNHKK